MRYNTFMSTTIVETRKIGSTTFLIVAIDDKYTVYTSKTTGEQEIKPDAAEYSAVASFDSLKEAKEYLDSRPTTA